MGAEERVSPKSITDPKPVYLLAHCRIDHDDRIEAGNTCCVDHHPISCRHGGREVLADLYGGQRLAALPVWVSWAARASSLHGYG